MSYEVICADVLDWAASYDGPPFMALLCDPPYSLGNGKRGFMNKTWDGDIAFNPDTWAALAEHLHPGAFGMAFASARGWHRLACAIEDAGLRIHPSIFGWAQGSGFPKATKVLKKEWEKTDTPNPNARPNSGRTGGIMGEAKGRVFNTELSAPATPLAQAWAGHRYGLQAMKPSLEPIIVFQKPYSGRPVESIVETGAGALWVDGGRIAGPPRTTHKNGNKRTRNHGPTMDEGFGIGEYPQPQGRWPANLVLTHLPGCERVGVKRVKGAGWRDSDKRTHSDHIKQLSSDGRDEGVQHYADPDGKETVADWRCEPECPVRRLGEMSGESKSPATVRGQGLKAVAWRNMEGRTDYGQELIEAPCHNDTGTAARFYYQADWQYEVAERLADADPVRYVAKAARKERDAGLEEWNLRNRDDVMSMNSHNHEGGIDGRGKPYKMQKIRNPHPTVKPIALTRWLATLLLPPDAYAPRRILIPFLGSGSEAIGAGLVGWEEITGIEFDADTCAIAEARLEHWLNRVQLELL